MTERLEKGFPPLVPKFYLGTLIRSLSTAGRRCLSLECQPNPDQPQKNFSTKNRAPMLPEAIREPLHAFMAGVLQKAGCAPVLINSMADHAHILFDLGRTVTVSQAVEEVKKSSTKWLKKQDAALGGFAWQAGYGAFAVSESQVPVIRAYIARQKEHHRKLTFQDEYRAFLKRNRIPYDERYLWD